MPRTFQSTTLMVRGLRTIMLQIMTLRTIRIKFPATMLETEIKTPTTMPRTIQIGKEIQEEIKENNRGPKGTTR